MLEWTENMWINEMCMREEENLDRISFNSYYIPILKFSEWEGSWKLPNPGMDHSFWGALEILMHQGPQGADVCIWAKVPGDLMHVNTEQPQEGPVTRSWLPAATDQRPSQDPWDILILPQRNFSKFYWPYKAYQSFVHHNGSFTL